MIPPEHVKFVQLADQYSAVAFILGDFSWKKRWQIKKKEAEEWYKKWKLKTDPVQRKLMPS